MCQRCNFQGKRLIPLVFPAICCYCNIKRLPENNAFREDGLRPQPIFTLLAQEQV